MEKVATPVPFRAADPICVVPSRKFTVPVAATGREFDTTAVNVTAVPSEAGLELEVSVVEVGCTASTCPERLMMPGLSAAFDVTDREPVTSKPVTVGAKSTPSAHVWLTGTACEVAHVVLAESSWELLTGVNAVKSSAAFPSFSTVCGCGAETRSTRIAA